MDDHENFLRQKTYWDSLSRLDPDTSVIDPRDTRGWKNEYLASIRDRALLGELRDRLQSGDVVLDFGCGTGSASIRLAKSGFRVLGLDLSQALLRQARTRCAGKNCTFVAINGTTIPTRDRTLDAAITYGVFCYLPDDSRAAAVLSAIRRALRPGAPLLLIEQARRARQVSDEGMKVQRTVAEWSKLIVTAGFTMEKSVVLRHGRFPTTPLVRYGVIPRAAWPMIARIERSIAALSGVWPWDYADVLFHAHA